MKIEDNFLDQNTFDKLQALLMSNDFDWYYNDGIDFEYTDSNGVITFPEEEDENKFQFIHWFYKHNFPSSPYFKEMIPIIKIIDPLSLWRIKANLLTKTPNIIENSFHNDILGILEEKLKHWTTSIFYVNTNNGYTKFEDGTKVESVANRIVSFPANMKHTGTSCTDEKRRIVINFNYFSPI